MFEPKNIRYIIKILSMILAVQLTENTSIKIIDEPFSTHHSGSQTHNFAPADKEIIAKVKPKRLSGPPHLFELEGKCFTLNKENYKYEFCPFHNVTQREQTYRWNAFHGALGIWKEWEITGGTYNAMHMTDGEACVGFLSREVRAFIKCGNDDKFVDITEPNTCKYNLTFETPLACATDAFLVYPTLSDHGKRQWQWIEESYHDNELTQQGYDKKRRNLFIQEGIQIDDAIEERRQSLQETSRTENSNGSSALNDYRLFGRHECIKKYGELLKEVELLRTTVKAFEDNETKNKQNDSQIETQKLLQKDGRNYTDSFSVSQNEQKSTANESVFKQKQHDDHEAQLVPGVGSRRSLVRRKGQKGDDGTNVMAKLREDSVIKRIDSILKNEGTSRKRVELTDEEQQKRDEEMIEKHKKTHRVH